MRLALRSLLLGLALGQGLAGRCVAEDFYKGKTITLVVANAAKVQEIEAAYADTQAELETINQRLRALENDLTKDRGRVAQLLAVLRRGPGSAAG